MRSVFLFLLACPVLADERQALPARPMHVPCEVQATNQPRDVRSTAVVEVTTPNGVVRETVPIVQPAPVKVTERVYDAAGRLLAVNQWTETVDGRRLTVPQAAAVAPSHPPAVYYLPPPPPVYYLPNRPAASASVQFGRFQAQACVGST